MPLPEQFATYDSRTGPQVTAERPTHRAVVRARALLARFDGEGMVQDVIDAVQLLRGATEQERPAGADPELWGEYARCTLRLWEVQGGAALLEEATRAAERAAASPHALRERAVLARVLHAAATDARRRGDRSGALDLLRRADREYAVACAAPGLDEGRRCGSPWNGSPPGDPVAPGRRQRPPAECRRHAGGVRRCLARPRRPPRRAAAGPRPHPAASVGGDGGPGPGPVVRGAVGAVAAPGTGVRPGTGHQRVRP